MITILEALKEAESKATDEVIVPRVKLRLLIEAAEMLRAVRRDYGAYLKIAGERLIATDSILSRLQEPSQ